MKTGRKYGEKEKIQILIKSLIFRTLQIYIFSFYAFLFFVSLADAKPFKDIAKHLIGCDLTDDVREMEETLTQILRDKVA